jgi:hypothetical protein
MRFFDCNCSFGHAARPALRYASTAAELLAEMDYCGIDRALVYHAGQRFGFPGAHNAEIVRDLRDLPRLLPVWAIMPDQTGEQPEPEQFIADMRRNGVKALWTFPEEHRYRLDRRTFGGLFALMANKRIPLFAKQNLEDLGDLLVDFPDLRVIAVNQGPHSLERYLRPLLDTFPNLSVDTSYYIVEGAIEELCERYGAHRLMFGSAFPDNCSGAALLRLAQAEIDDEARQAIASGNLERLLEEVLP